jgi:hypothetical protein
LFADTDLYGDSFYHSRDREPKPQNYKPLGISPYPQNPPPKDNPPNINQYSKKLMVDPTSGELEVTVS